MEIGPVLALMATVSLAISQVLIRRGVYHTEEAFTATVITVFVSTIPFLFIIPLTGDWNRLWSLSWQGFVLLGAAGIVHFVIGRYMIFDSIRLIGANKATPLGRTHALFAVLFGIILLHEPLTVPLIPGALFIVGGATLVSFKREVGISNAQTRGILLGLGSGSCAGVSAMLIRLAMAEIGSPYAAAFISYVAASLIMAVLLCHRKLRVQLFQLTRSSLYILVIAGIFSLAAYLLRYAALGYSPISVVQPLMATGVLFVFFLSFVLNRKIDVFNWRVIAGILFVVAGTFLLFL